MTASCQQHKDELFIALQRLLPQHLCSRALGKLGDSKITWLKDLLIRSAIRQYHIELEDALQPSPNDYASFNDFFTRRLKSDARPVDTAPSALVAPADGAISQIGRITEGRIFQAKGHDFSTAALLNCPPEFAQQFNGGSFTTVYLSPKDYHRVHVPFDGRLIEASYIPGQLFSVNDTTAQHVDGLFARNERLSCLFETEQGLIAVVMVGALFVAGIQTVWQSDYTPGMLSKRYFPEKPMFKKGDELGAFRFGSTAIIVAEKAVQWRDSYEAGSSCRMGEALGSF